MNEQFYVSQRLSSDNGRVLIPPIARRHPGHGPAGAARLFLVLIPAAMVVSTIVSGMAESPGQFATTNQGFFDALRGEAAGLSRLSIVCRQVG